MRRQALNFAKSMAWSWRHSMLTNITYTINQFNVFSWTYYWFCLSLPSKEKANTSLSWLSHVISPLNINYSLQLAAYLQQLEMELFQERYELMKNREMWKKVFGNMYICGEVSWMNISKLFSSAGVPTFYLHPVDSSRYMIKLIIENDKNLAFGLYFVTHLV